VRRDVPGGAWELVDEFIELENGKKSDRPQLARAVDALSLSLRGLPMRAWML
jgi:hypothetical protein